MLGQDNDRVFGPRTLSDISVASSASSKAQHNSAGSGQMPFDATAKNVHGRRVKFMCSFGGKILPRPSDRKLRYVGGETRMVSVPRHVRYDAFVNKMVEIYGHDFSLKYQLPEEDLDALVSVSSDEDLENMMEECDRLEAMEGTCRLRVFIFRAYDHKAGDLSNVADPKVAEQRYVEAVNAVVAECTLRKHDDLGLAISSRNSDEPETYSCNYVHPEVQSMENFVAASHNLESIMVLPAFDSLSLPSFTTLTGQGGGGVELAKANQDAIMNQDLLDLESADSTGSSNGSQHDYQNKYANYLLASNSQTQVGQGLAWCNVNGEYQTRKPEPSFTMDIENQAIGTGGFSENASIVNPLTSVMEMLCVPSQREVASVLDDVLHNPHVEWHPRDMLSNTFGVAVCEPKTGLQWGQIVEEENVLQKQSFISPFSEIEPAEFLSAPATPTTNLSSGFLPASSAHFSPLEPLLVDLSEQQYEVSCTQDEGLTNGVAQASIFLDLSHPVLSNSMALVSALNERETVPAFSQHLGMPTEELAHYVSHNVDIGAARESLLFAPQNSVCLTSSLAKMPSSSALQQGLFGESTFTFPRAQCKQEQLDKDVVGSPLVGSSPMVSMVTDLLEASHLSEQGTPKISNLSDLTVDLLLDLHNVPTEVGGMEKDASLIEPSTRDVANDDLDHWHNSFFSKEISNVRQQEVVQSFIGAPSELQDKKNDVRNGDHLPPRAPLLGILETDLPKAALVTTQRTSFQEITHGIIQGMAFQEAKHVHLGIGKSLKESEEMELSLTVNNMEVLPISKLISEDLDKAEPMEEETINAAAAAEAEAIAFGLQTIRNCDLEELRELGSGTFGTVYHGKWRGTDVAIKRIKSSVFTGRPPERDRLIADFWREACLLGQLHHPNVVAFYGVVPDGPGGTLATVTEYMVNGSLKQVLLKNERVLDRQKRLLIAMDAAFGMEYLHGKNVIHFDMKCENLLVNLRDTHRPICKVGDLGLSKVKQQTMVSGGVRGTLPWMAPELLNGSSSLVSEKVDVYSFGIVLWELLTGEEPYADMHYGAIIGGIVNNMLRPPIPRWCDPAWRSLMERCWLANPSERPTFSEITASLRAMEASLRQGTPATSP